MTTTPKIKGAARLPASTPNDHSNNLPQRDANVNFVESFLKSATRCGNCEIDFGATNMPSCLAGIRNRELNSIYVLCATCAAAFKRLGGRGIPNCAKDASLAYQAHTTVGGVQ